MSGLSILYLTLAILNIVLLLADEPFIEWRERVYKPFEVAENPGEEPWIGVDGIHIAGAVFYLIVLLSDIVLLFLSIRLGGFIIVEALFVICLYLFLFCTAVIEELENKKFSYKGWLFVTTLMLTSVHFMAVILASYF